MPLLRAGDDLSFAGQSRSGLELVMVRDGRRCLHYDGADAAARLRAEQYVIKRGWLTPCALTATGGESDRYDDRAQHFAILDRTEIRATAIATVRFIRPRDGDLPIFEVFGELFFARGIQLAQVRLQGLACLHQAGGSRHGAFGGGQGLAQEVFQPGNMVL